MRNINDIYNSTSVALIKQQQQKSDNFKKMQNIVLDQFKEKISQFYCRKL